MLRGLAVLAFVTLLACPMAATGEPLVVGDDVPPFAVDEWLGTTGPDNLDENAVYVIAFFDPTSRESIWTLELMGVLHKVHPDIQFLGITMEYREQTLDLVERGQAFPLGMDTDRSVFEGWLIAARQYDVPTVFVVGSGKRIEWFGHPIRLEYILGSIADGTWDPYVDKANDGLRRDLEIALGNAVTDEEWDAGLDILDRMIALGADTRDPTARRYLERAMGLRFHMMLAEMGETDRAYSFARRVRLEFPDHAIMLNDMAWYIVDEPGVEWRDLDLAYELAIRANEFTTFAEPAHLDTLARVHFEMGDVDKAIEIQKLAVTIVEEGAPMRDELMHALERYLEAAESKGD